MIHIIGSVGAVVTGYLILKTIRSRSTAATNRKRKQYVFITGGTSGVGASLAERFRELGDEVVIGSRRCGTDVQARTIKVDVSDGDDVANAVKLAREMMGGHLTMVIANAGISQSPHTPLVDTPIGEITRVINTNLLGSLFTARAAAHQLSEGGNIVFVSGAGTTGRATPNFLSYGASKAGYSQIVKTLSQELKSCGIGVHCLSPGMVVTPLLMGYDQKREAKSLRIFNILAEAPSTVAIWAVHQLKGLGLKSESPTFLTPLGVVFRFICSPFRTKNRLVDEETGEILIT